MSGQRARRLEKLGMVWSLADERFQEANDLLVAAAKETAPRARWPAASGVRAGVTPDR
ncbi:hypothetical protein [Streptomyces coeruleorubidus]|uniref:hypothetical protein n=1 Tax=Streptomyces coeruleorubidus TaxID=116188 RepID=UPI0033DB5CCD